jgi:hypothetical protein
VIEQVLAPHGYAAIPWDHAAGPEVVAKHLKALPNKCWVLIGWKQLRLHQVRAGMFTRLTLVESDRVWRFTPTCGDTRCINPAHLCVTLRTPLTTKEEGSDGDYSPSRRRGPRVCKPVGGRISPRRREDG